MGSAAPVVVAAEVVVVVAHVEVSFDCPLEMDGRREERCCFLLKILISCVRRLNFVKLRESLVSTSHTYSAIGPK